MKTLLIAGVLVLVSNGTTYAQTYGLTGNKSCMWGTGGCPDPSASASAHALDGSIAGQVHAGSAGTLNAPGSSYTTYSIGVANSITATGGSTVNATQRGKNTGAIDTKGIYKGNISNN